MPNVAQTSPVKGLQGKAPQCEGKASAVSSVELISKKHHRGTPRGVRAELRGTTSSKRRKVVSGLTEKGVRNRQERAVAGRALIRRASDHRGGRWRSGKSEPTEVLQEGTQHRVSDHLQEWVPHVAFSRHHRRRRERPLTVRGAPHLVQRCRGHAGYRNPQETGWAERKVQQTRMSPRVTLLRSNAVRVSEKTTPNHKQESDLFKGH